MYRGSTGEVVLLDLASEIVLRTFTALADVQVQRHAPAHQT